VRRGRSVSPAAAPEVAAWQGPAFPHSVPWMFLQTGVVLFDRAPSLSEVAAALVDVPVARRRELDGNGGYWFGGEGTLLVEVDSGRNGGIAIEIFHRPWPDSMGSPETDAELFGAWAMRQFGLMNFPYGLARANAEGAAARADHVAFVRLNLSYVFGASDDAEVCPADRDVAAELRALAHLAQLLCDVAGAVGWFAPNGEVWLPVALAREKLARQASGELSLELWVTTRAYPAGNRLLVETVGVAALSERMGDAYDHQVVVLPELALAGDVVSRFVLELSGAARGGSSAVPSEPVLGPGGRWQAMLVETDNPPPRKVVRWLHESQLDSPISVAELDDDEAEAWGDHLHSVLGGEYSVFHELISDTIHLDVLVFPATDWRQCHVLVTQGMSALPMTVPEGAESFRYAELMITLPPDWVIEGDEADEERWYWPMRLLKSVARLPHLYDTWVGVGHTIPNSDPSEPYAAETKQCCAIVTPLDSFPDELKTCEVSEGKLVRLYALTPIYEDEMRYKLEHGFEKLFERMAERQLTELVDPGRRSVLAKRFWVV
jgi:Suppressor of fused protein (SUFU)